MPALHVSDCSVVRICPHGMCLIGPQVRAHEKAVDLYSDRFPGEPPEACVADYLRARVVCDTVDNLLKLVYTLRDGFDEPVRALNP
eukprot:4028109-Pyramimonas_sp.AAC.1